MKELLLICLLFTAQLSYGQNEQLLASNYDADAGKLLEDPESLNSEIFLDEDDARMTLKKFVTKYLSYKPNKYIYVGCNEQDQYYENDTVRMRRITDDYYPVWECCKFVEWSLVDDAQFLWSDLKTCKDGIQRSYYLSTNKVNVFEKEQSLFLDIYRNGSPLERFKLLDIEKSSTRNSTKPDAVLVLLRQEMPK